MTIGRKTGGRPKGGLNKTTRNVKQALERAFERLGGVRSLVAWGRENPTEFYKLWAKLLPKDLNLTMQSEAIQLGEDVRARLDEIDGIGPGFPRQIGSGDVGDVADAAAPANDQFAFAGHGGGEAGPAER